MISVGRGEKNLGEKRVEMTLESNILESHVNSISY